MQINKKIYSSLIVAILALSTIALAIPAVLAINAPTLTPNNGPVGQKVTVSGTGATGFGLVEVFWDSLGTKIAEGYATGAGAFEIKNVVIPEGVAGAHNIIVKDDLSSGTAASAFTITSKVTISANKALPGDSLTVAGTGFGGEVPARIYLGAITSVSAESVTVATPVLAGTPVVITTVDLAVDVTIDGDVGGDPIVGATSLDISVTDDGNGVLSGTATGVPVDDGVVTYSGAVDITITGTINYATGAITLSAVGVDDGSGDAVTDIVITIDVIDADYDYAVYDATPAAGITTSALGSFSATSIVPNVPVAAYGDYLVTVIDADENSASPAIAALTINYYIIVNPVSGPAGITATLTGRIPANTAYEIRLDTTTIATGTSGADTTFTQTHTLSSFLAIGPHTFYVVWGVTNSRDAAFTLTNPPQMALSSASGMSGTVITISSVAGRPFSSGANLTLYLNGVVINSTAMDSRFGPTHATTGLFTDITFTVPTLAPGVYSIKLEDAYGASTGTLYTFTVLATPVTSVALSATTYNPGDTLSFVISTTDASTTNVDVTIRDPTGAVWWTADNWVLTGTAVRRVLYQDQLYGSAGVRATLPDDAPLGSWNWTVTYTTSAATTNKATALFTVAAKATLDTVTADIANLVDEISDISGDLATIKTNVNNVKNLVEALDIDFPDMTALTNDVASLKVSVNSLDAVVTAIAGDVATVDTKVGTLTGTITSIEGDVATIQTNVGTLQADISDIKANVDNTPAWIAVVLALVAAVAAIFAVITIRQKIAG